ncbi:hypothetical protein HAX54_051646 [Datura stramonium]|uniref:Uncharacterized protein n=1 Tax=Datura stramonium TaxID=4076 RepID=A0ABS8SYT8_DATST|nr:hypothetical protein [Datura stramonium]
MPRPRDQQREVPRHWYYRLCEAATNGMRRTAFPCYSRCATVLPRDKARAAALLQCVGRCAAALDVEAAWGYAARSFQLQKLDLPLQYGKGTLNPKSNSSRNKQSINLLL